MTKINLFIYTILISIIFTLGYLTYFYKNQSLERLNTINIMQIDLDNTRFNLRKANENIDMANKNLEEYINLNNKLNKQLKNINSNQDIHDIIEIEVKQINCLFEHMDQFGDCVNGEFIKN